MKKYTLDLGNKKQNKFLQIRTNDDEKKFLEIVKNQLNSLSPYFDFSVSDIVRMGAVDFGQRILSGDVKVKIDVKAKDITFKIKKKNVLK